MGSRLAQPSPKECLPAIRQPYRPAATHRLTASTLRELNVPPELRLLAKIELSIGVLPNQTAPYLDHQKSPFDSFERHLEFIQLQGHGVTLTLQPPLKLRADLRRSKICFRKPETVCAPSGSRKVARRDLGITSAHFSHSPKCSSGWYCARRR
jgi:hypothetical protein